MKRFVCSLMVLLKKKNIKQRKNFKDVIFLLIMLMNISIIFIAREHICVMLCADKLPMWMSFDQDTSRNVLILVLMCNCIGTRQMFNISAFTPHTNTDLLIHDNDHDGYIRNTLKNTHLNNEKKYENFWISNFQSRRWCQN